MIDQSALPSAESLGLRALVHVEQVASTMDEAHTLARAGEQGGLLVVADRQEFGRGRAGKNWASRDHAGLWITLLERPSDASMLRVLSLRLGLVIAAAVQRFVSDAVLVKWPNDLCTPHGKLGGILVEARWREHVVDWVAIGVGINLDVPEAVTHAVSLRAGTARGDLLREIIPPMRRAVQGAATLDARELASWSSRDIAAGRRIVAPVAGIVRGIASDGALLVREPGGSADTRVQAGSIEFADV